jgi:hypothetical protein
MARILSQTLTLVQKRAQSLAQRALVPSSLLLRRAQSSRSGKNKGELIEGELIEIEIRSNLPEEDQGNPASDLDADSEMRPALIGIKRLQDAIQGVIVKRSAPDWLPFVPGASYWVPPLKKPIGPIGVMELVSGVANERGEVVLMSEEESLSFTSVRGYPSSTYFLEGTNDLI